MNTKLRLAICDDIDAIMEIMREAKDMMHREGRRQWDDSYPAPLHIEEDIAQRRGWVLADCGDGRIMAYGAIDFDGEEAYREIDGAWLSTDEPYVVVHRLAVSRQCRGLGLSALFLAMVMEMARKKGVKSFKIDTNHDNAAMLKILSNLGFTRCGIIHYPKGERIAFEKPIL